MCEVEKYKSIIPRCRRGLGLLFKVGLNQSLEVTKKWDFQRLPRPDC